MRVGERKKEDYMKIYEALYTSCVYESAAATISLHKTKLGAYKAIRKSKEDAFNEWLERHRDGKRAQFRSRAELGLRKLHTDDYKFDAHQWWGINETELLD